MIIIAHRGASAYAPENTEAAFDLGISLGADALETDLRVTSDGVIVLLHDAKVDRTTDGHGHVADLPWSTVRSLDAGIAKHPRYVGQRIPTLEWLLERYAGRCPLYLEIKTPAVVEPAVTLVRRYKLLDQVVFTSFDFESVEQVASLDSVRTCWLVHDWTRDEAARAESTGLDEVSINARQVSPEVVKRVNEAGLDARAWGLKDENLMLRAVEAGVAGVTIDFPDRLVRLLRPAVSSA